MFEGRGKGKKNFEENIQPLIKDKYVLCEKVGENIWPNEIYYQAGGFF